MFAFDEEEKKHSKTRSQLIMDFLFISIVFIDANYIFVGLCLNSIDKYSFGSLSLLLLLFNYFIILFYNYSKMLKITF